MVSNPCIEIQATAEHRPWVPAWFAEVVIIAVCAPGYKGRKRGEVVRTRTTALQMHTRQWIATYAGKGNGDYRVATLGASSDPARAASSTDSKRGLHEHR